MQQDVFGLDVAVDHAVAVRVIECTGDATGQPDRLLDGQVLLSLEAVPQRFTCHVRHHIVDQAPGLAGIEQWQDVRVLQPGGHPDLTQEALDAEHGGELGTQHLQGDVAIVLEIACQIYRCHATGTDFTLDSVVLGEGRPETFERVGHGIPTYRAAKRAARAAPRNPFYRSRVPLIRLHASARPSREVLRA